MSKLMWIAGILLIAAGVAFGAVNLTSLQPTAAKISLDTSAILLVGGILALGIGSVIDALHAQRPALVERVTTTAAAVVAPPVASSGVAHQGADAEAPAAGKVEAALEAAKVSEPTRNTIDALEQARQKMEQAFQPKQDATEKTELAKAAAEAVEEAAEDAVVEDEVVDETAVIEDGQLYVVEERIIRTRPARILSDGTVEAETDDGWMRFENLEHLDEYLDAMEQAQG